MKKNEAFTLVELLVVIAIIGLLLAILLPAIGAVFGSSQRRVCQVSIQQIETSLRLYESDYRDYPPSTVAQLGLSKENKVNSGNESMVLCLSSKNKTDSYFEFKEDNLENNDFDSSPIPLSKLTGSIFQTNSLLELNDPWGNPYVYFHHRDLHSASQQEYNIGGQRTVVTPFSGQTKTGNFPGYGRYQIISSGPDMKIHSEDDIRSE